MSQAGSGSGTTQHESIRLRLEQVRDYEFRIMFDGTELEPLMTDEPPPLGGGNGPNPSRLLLAAIANCLSASLLFALRKFKNQPGPVHAEVIGTLGRNEAGRLRVENVEVRLQLADTADGLQQLERILAQFEAFCVVTESVRNGIPVDVSVVDADGRQLGV
jgi:organic hydroperoxide reductase OsmC/OhrA